MYIMIPQFFSSHILRGIAPPVSFLTKDNSLIQCKGCVYSTAIHRLMLGPCRLFRTGVTQNFQKVWSADGNEVNDAYSPQFKV